MERFGLDFGTTNTSLTWARGEGLPVLCAVDAAAPDPHVLRTLLYFSRRASATSWSGGARSTSIWPRTCREP